MAELTLTRTGIRDGIWEGVLTEAAPNGAAPEIEATHDARPVDGVTLEPVTGRDGIWTLRVPIPADRLSDGVQTFVISDRATGARLDSFAVLAGEGLEDDIRAELDLLRAELDLLKRAFRRHCNETAP